MRKGILDMDEKDRAEGLPSADEAVVLEVTPEPDSDSRDELLGEDASKEPAESDTEVIRVSLQKERPEEREQGQPLQTVEMETAGNVYHYGEEDRQETETAQAGQGYEDVHAQGDSRQMPPLFDYDYGNKADSPQTPPPSGYSYGGGADGQQAPPPSGYSYGSGAGSQQIPPPVDPGYDGRENGPWTPPPAGPGGPGYGPGGYGPQGYQQQGYGPYQPPKKNNNMALASLILGVLSILLCCCGGFGIILGAVGIVLAILSRGREPMETSAKVGLGLSIGGIVLGIIVLVMAFAAVGSDQFRSEFRSELYRNGYGDYEDPSHYFDHGGM